jgi:hypothetical protein
VGIVRERRCAVDVLYDNRLGEVVRAAGLDAGERRVRVPTGGIVASVDS